MKIRTRLITALLLLVPAAGSAADLFAGPLYAGSGEQYRITACNVHTANSYEMTLSICRPLPSFTGCQSSTPVIVGANQCISQTLTIAGLGGVVGEPAYGRASIKGPKKSMRASFHIVNSAGDTTLAVAGAKK
jgi:hypothetical protein